MQLRDCEPKAQSNQETLLHPIEGTRVLLMLLREPLVHFLVLGAVLFVSYRLVAPELEPRTIVISRTVRGDIERQLEAERGRRISPAELREALDVWKRTEVLYREGQRLKLDRDDPFVRSRIAAKMHEVTRKQLILPKPSTEALSSWQKEHRALYDGKTEGDTLRAELEADFQNAAQVRATHEALRRLASQYEFVEEP